MRKPDAVIVLTDGFTPFPERTLPGIPLLFGIITDEAWRNPGPPMPPFKASDVFRIPIHA